MEYYFSFSLLKEWVLGGGGRDGRIGSLGLADANYYIQNG